MEGAEVDLNAYRNALPAEMRGLVVEPGGDAYGEATTPQNASADQAPGAVLLAARSEHVVAAVRAAAETGVQLVPQATGHGAAGPIGDESVLLSTSRMDGVEIDPVQRIARVGAGATFGQINSAAYRHGLLALAGTAPGVAVVGYTALGGVGWLTRPHGLASASLVGVTVVDGSGREIDSDDDHDEDLIWVFRGGAGAGIATSMELRLYPADELMAGYVLWTIDDADTVLPAWGDALTSLDPALSSALGVLHAPEAPAVPEALQGHRVVHLSAATVGGEAAAASFLHLLQRLPEPAVNTFGPADAERLAQIHIDPPAPVPAIGEGRWLTARAAERVVEILTAAGTQDDAPLAEVELRHVQSPGSDVPGALTTVPGDLLLHATGPAPTPGARAAVLDALDQVRAAIDPVDTGFSASAFRDGRPSGNEALPAAVLRRADEIRRTVDPDRVIRPARAAGEG